MPVMDPAPGDVHKNCTLTVKSNGLWPPLLPTGEFGYRKISNCQKDARKCALVMKFRHKEGVIGGFFEEPCFGVDPDTNGFFR